MRLVVTAESRSAGTQAKQYFSTQRTLHLLMFHSQVQHQWGKDIYSSHGSGERIVDI